MSAPAGWLDDPTGRHQHRYWDGAAWTDHISDNGAQGTDPVVAAEDPQGASTPTTPEVVHSAPAPAPAPRPAQFTPAPMAQPVQPFQVQVVQKKSGGCLKAIGIATIAFVALVVIIIVVAVISASNDAPKKVNGIASNSLNSDHPPQADVALTACTADEFGLPKVSGVITNHSTGPSNYTVHVSFEQNGTRVAEGYAYETQVQPNQPTNVDTVGDKQVTGAVTCKVTSVDRFAS